MRAVLTDHARERCQEMGVGTKLVKALFRPDAEYDYDRPGPAKWGPHRLRVCNKLCVAYTESGEPGILVVKTVLWATPEEYRDRREVPWVN